MAPRLLVAALLTLALPARSSPEAGHGVQDRRPRAVPAADVAARADGGSEARPPSFHDRGSGNRDASSGLVSLAVTHGDASRLRRRDGGEGLVTSPLTTRSDVAYYTELEIGNPPQRVRVQLDTGSFELWVNADCGNLTTPGDMSFCRDSRRYEAGRSQTAQPERQAKSLRYGIGAANITYVRDDIGLPGSGDVMNQVRFGVADSSEDQFSGILGIGFGRGVTVNYNNFMDELTRQGLTRTKTCGVGLGSKAEARGAITFGGVDTSKFAGRLAALPIVPAARSPDGVPRYWVELRSISHTGPGAGSPSEPMPGAALPVFLDTGATLTLLPPAVVRAMARALGADVDGRSAMFQETFYRLPCDLAAKEGSFDFAFDGVTVFVPYAEMIRQLAQPGQSPVCYLGLMESQKFSLLGDTFLRSAYVVFDLDRNMTYMARHANCGSTPQVISPTTRLQGMAGRCDEPSLARSRLGAASNGSADGQRGDERSAAASGPVPDAASLWAVVGAAACALVPGLV